MRKEPHIHRLRRVAIGATVAGSLLLAGCGALRDDSGRPLTTLNPKGKQAQSIDDLVSPVFWVAGVVKEKKKAKKVKKKKKSEYNLNKLRKLKIVKQKK